jgi:phosphatidylserine/phosphatidylglycerophosphate/cardiolipin synthase-like enzyme
MRQIRGFFFILVTRGLAITSDPAAPMNLTHHLQQSLEDFYFSKSEKNVLKSLLSGELHDRESVNRIRAKVLELAAEQVTEKNYRLVMQWVKDVNHVLQQSADQQSHAFFSPGEDCRQAIIRQMNLSLRELKICVFTISDDEISRAILAAHRKGVAVRIITDNEKSLDQGSDIDKFAREGIEVKMDNSKNHMHHKFMIRDKQSVITGSYNWTLSAARFNHENILLTKEPVVVDSYTNSFDRLWQEMVAYDRASR